MTTSLDDLLTALDHVSTAPTIRNPRDAAHALHWTHRLLERVRADGVGVDHPDRDETVRRLADACQQAGIAFEHGPGRAGDLAAVICDTAGRFRRHLSDEDRWATAIRLAVPARHWARAIAAAGPSATPPQLLTVADRSRELLHVAAVSPPDLDVVGGLDLPIPSSMLADPAASITQGLAALAGELHRTGREPLSARELIAACHATYQAAAYTAILTRRTASPAAAGAHAAAASWRTVRETVALYADSARPRPRPSVIMRHATRLDAEVRHAIASEDADPTCDVSQVARHLRYVAAACTTEFGRIAANLIVPPGPRSLQEDRIGEWLQRKTFAATAPDLRPALDSLRHANEVSMAFARSMQAVSTSADASNLSSATLAAAATPICVPEIL